MAYKTTTALKKILKMNRRLRIVQGGTRAGKTVAILLILVDIAQTQKDMIISVVSESMPHLRRGAIRDFLDILKQHNYFKRENWDKTNSIYTFETGTIIEFFGADQPAKVRGHKRDILFINECNNVSYEIYTQLAIRTTRFIYLDYNPVSEFWVHEKLLYGKSQNFEILTYKDNEFLAKEVIKEIESRKGNKNFWKVYGLGQLGEAEGRIYTGWQIVDGIPHEARLERYGLDFGYSNDPTAIVAVYYYNGGYILDEITFLKGLSNKQIADILLNEANKALVIADSAEPKSIDEIASYGVNIRGSKKGQGSVLQGIQYVQGQQISVTKRSLNLIKEYRNYLWDTDKEGKVINVAEKGFDHAMDALRYAMESLRPVNDDEDLPDDTALFTKDGFY